MMRLAQVDATDRGTARVGHGEDRSIQRLKRLADHSHDGGFGLGESGVRVTPQRALVEKLTAMLF